MSTVPIQNFLEKQEALKNDDQGTIDYSVKKKSHPTSCQEVTSLSALISQSKGSYLFLESASLNSIFAFPEYSNLVDENDVFFIYRVNKEEV